MQVNLLAFAQACETEETTGFEHPVRLDEHGGNVGLRKQVEHKVRDPSIVVLARLGGGRSAFRKGNLRTTTETSEPGTSKSDHRRAQIDAAVGRGVGEALRE